MIAALVVGSFGLGLGIGLLLHLHWSRDEDLDRHWRTVIAYRAYLNGENKEFSGSTDSQFVSLAALVAAGQLEHLDLVLPTVSSSNKAAVRFWMEYCSKHKDIMVAFGNPTYMAYPVSGEQPLHLRLWFRPRAQPDVQSMVQRLEALGAETVATRQAVQD